MERHTNGTALASEQLSVAPSAASPRPPRPRRHGAIAAYLTTGRPRRPEREVFLCAVAPAAGAHLFG